LAMIFLDALQRGKLARRASVMLPGHVLDRR
jgi:hypothetical protein